MVHAVIDRRLLFNLSVETEAIAFTNLILACANTGVEYVINGDAPECVTVWVKWVIEPIGAARPARPVPIWHLGAPLLAPLMLPIAEKVFLFFVRLPLT